eukprot:PhM_4_TR2700/c0_g1_i1/m.1583
MNRTISLDNLTGIARGTIGAVMRFLPLRGNRELTLSEEASGGASGALMSICKLLETSMSKGIPVEETDFSNLVHVFCLEVKKEAVAAQDDGKEQAASTLTAVVFRSKSKAQLREERLLYFLQVLRLLCKTSPQLVHTFVSGEGLKAVEALAMAENPNFSSPRVAEAAALLLLDLLSDFPDSAALAEIDLVAGLVLNHPLAMPPSPPNSILAFRGLHLIYHLLKRWDSIPDDATQHNGTRFKTALVDEKNVAGVLFGRMQELQDVGCAGDPVVTSYAVLVFSVIGGLLRGCDSAREAMRTQYSMEEFYRTWSWCADAVCSPEFIEANDGGKNSPVLTRAHSFESGAATPSAAAAAGFTTNLDTTRDADYMAAWMGEMMDVLLDVMCKNASFALERQALCSIAHSQGGADSPLEVTPRAQTPRSPATGDAAFQSNRPTPRSSGLGVFAPAGSSQAAGCRLLLWSVPGVTWCGYPRSMNSDITSSVSMLWRFVCAMPRCDVRGEAVCVVLRSLMEREDVVKRYLLVLTLLLCRANPVNSSIIAEGECITLLLEALTSSEYSRTNPLWQLMTSIIMTSISYHVSPMSVEYVLRQMSQADTSETNAASTLDVVNAVLRAVPSSVPYPAYWHFDGKSAHVAGTIERWPGARTGYTLTIAANSSCVWQGGMTLVSIYEPSTRELMMAVQFVPWQGSKYVAITTYSKQQRTTTVMKERALEDKWHSISVHHSRSGFAVSIDGTKLESCPSTLYPSKPCTVYVGGLPLLKKDSKTMGAAGQGTNDFYFTSFYFGRIASLVVHDGGNNITPILGLAASSAPAVMFEHKFDHSTLAPDVSGIRAYAAPSAVQTLAEARVVERACEQLFLPDAKATSKLIALRCLCIVAQSGSEGTALFVSNQGFDALERYLNMPGNITAEHMDTIIEMASSAERRVFRTDTEWTHQCLNIVVKVFYRAVELWDDEEEALLCRAATLRRLGEVLSNANNSAVWMSGPGLEALLRLGARMPKQYASGVVAVMEKLCTTLPDMEKIIAFAGLRPNSEFTCLMVRMLFDVCKNNPVQCKLLAAGNAWAPLLFLMRGSADVATSELVRVHALRLYALLLHDSEKVRATFLKGTGFDTLYAAMQPPAPTQPSPATIPTFDCLFQFALDGFHPSPAPNTTTNNSGNNSNNNAAKRGSTGSDGLGDFRLMHSPSNISPSQNPDAAHTPNLFVVPSPVYSTIQRESILRSYNMMQSTIDLGTDAHNPSMSETIIFPHAIRVILQLLPTATDENATEVLKYLEQLMSVKQNIYVMLAAPWLEWIMPVLSMTSPSVQNKLRGVVRRLVGRDITQPSKSCFVPKLREMCECHDLQLLVLEEFIAHLTSNSRLDALDSADVSNTLKNMETLFAVDEYMSPVPTSIALSITDIVGAVTATSGTQIRAKMKNTKLFDVRDRLAFHLLFHTHQNHVHTDMHSFTRLESLFSCCPRDPNACILLLKMLVDALQNDAPLASSGLVALVRTFASEEEQRKVIARFVTEPDTLDRLVSGRREVEEFVSWSRGGGASAWMASSQKVLKAFAVIEADMAAKQEKRQKDVARRLRTRKAEEERKVAAYAKSVREDDERRVEALAWSTERAQLLVPSSGSLSSLSGLDDQSKGI